MRTSASTAIKLDGSPARWGARWGVASLVILLIGALLPYGAAGADADSAGSEAAELSVSGRVWEDTNVDGLRGSSEQGFPSVPVLLAARTADGGFTQIERTSTDASGDYSFSELSAGEYRVQFLLIDAPFVGLAFTYQDQGDDDTTDSDADPFSGYIEPIELVDAPASANDAGLLRTPDYVSIAGVVWEDWDDDGILGKDERLLSDVTVTLTKEMKPKKRKGQPRGKATFKSVRTIRTHPAFGYAFFVPENSGRYQVDFGRPQGFERSLQDQGTDDAIDSDVDQDKGKSPVIGSDSSSETDAGLVPLTSIGDRAWVDANGDGLQGGDEEGLPDVSVSLFQIIPFANQPLLVDSTKTDDEGLYEFAGQRPGSYFLRFLPPTGFGFTTFQVPDDPAIDSDAMQRSGDTPDFTLPEDVLSAEQMAQRRFLTSLAAPFLDPLRRADARNGQGGAEIGGVDAPGGGGADGRGGAAGIDFETYLTKLIDAGFLPGVGLPSTSASVDDDPVACDPGKKVKDPEVTISDVRVVRLPNGDHVFVVDMKQGLTKDFSFAALLQIRTPMGILAFMWEIHDKKLRIGQIDPDTGEIIKEVGEDLQIVHDQKAGTITFTIGADLLAKGADVAAVRTFHTRSKTAQTNCHASGTLEIPQATDV